VAWRGALPGWHRKKKNGAAKCEAIASAKRTVPLKASWKYAQKNEIR
jgi:hypothetical protein